MLFTRRRNPKILEVTPKLILRAGAALNGAYALFLDNLFQGATAYVQQYQRSESFTVSQRLFRHWQARFPQLGPGDEYTLVDEFADMIGLRGWYEWKPDTGTHTLADASNPEGTSNPGLLRMRARQKSTIVWMPSNATTPCPLSKSGKSPWKSGWLAATGLITLRPTRITF